MAATKAMANMTPDERSEYMRTLGRKGAAVTMERYGMEALIEHARQRRLERPSAPEVEMIDLLLSLGYTAGVDYVREWYPLGQSGLLTLDFAIPEKLVGIEVDGPVHGLFGDPDKATARAARLAEAGWTILTVSSEEIATEETATRVAELFGR